MSNSRDVRELQFTRMQLVIVFVLVIALGAFIFVLGVSVGKKQAGLSQGTEKTGELSTEVIKPKVKTTTMLQTQKPKPQAGETKTAAEKKKPAAAASDIQKEIASFKAQEKPAVKTSPESSKKSRITAAKPAVEPKKTAPPKTTTAPVRTAKPSANLFYIQVAAATQRTEAAKLADDIRKMGFSVIILDPLPSDRVAYYRVRVGGYASEDDRNRAAARLATALNKKPSELYFPPLEKN